jgi:epoxyqueuosine reductase
LTLLTGAAIILGIMVTLNQELTAFLKSKGASLVGFADLGELDSDSRDGFPFGISIAVALDAQVISEITGGPTRRYYDEIYKVSNLLNNLSEATEHFLIEEGYKAYGLPSTTHWISPGAGAKDFIRRSKEPMVNLSTKLPHKTAATRSGLGWIGKCALLVTKEYGSAVRLTNVLTDAPLSCGKPVKVSFCGDCVECVKICPAPSGKNWQTGVARESFFNASVCQKEARELAFKTIGERVTLCGRCIVACPWTKKYLGKTV